ncbi:MAG: NnrS family protein [Planctomycetota bacterium]
MERAQLVPTWRQQPYRILFPLGVVLAWAGVLPWVLFGLDAGEYRLLFHRFAQAQGFLACFVFGFLFTMIPRRTQTEGPNATEMAIAVAMPVATTAFAWWRFWVWSQLCWVILLGTLLVFIGRRFGAAADGHGPPRSFVLLPVAILMGLVGSLLVTAGFAGIVSPAVDQLGRLLLLQGTLVALVLGVGGMLLPLITRGVSPAVSGSGDRPARRLHLAAALALIATFAVEVWGSVGLGLALRAAVVAAVLLGSSRIHRPPTRPGWHRWLVWLSAWCLPVGYAVAALWPDRAQLGLHVVFIGGFAQMALSVGLHVALAHSEVEGLAFGRPWQVPAMGVLLLGAMVFRGLVLVAPERMAAWLAVSGASFLMATACWAWLALPHTLAGWNRR